MYCSSCGCAITPGLSYCNRCGAELSTKKPDSTKAPEMPESLVWAIVAVSVGGLALIIGLMAVMKNELHFETNLILLFSLLSFLLLLLAEIVFIWVLQSSVKHARNRERDATAAELRGRTTNELEQARELFLNEPVLSVTENTTRTLETAARERKPN